MASKVIKKGGEKMIMSDDSGKEKEISGINTEPDKEQNADVNLSQKEAGSSTSRKESSRERARLTCETGGNTLYKTGMFAGKTAAGIGLGVAAGIGTVIAAAAAEIVVPVALVLKVFGLTGGAMGFIKGMKHTRN